MSVLSSDPAALKPVPAFAPPPWLAFVCAILGASILTFVVFGPRIGAVWLHDAFYDPDDAMRLVEIRAWLAGQHWFDMTAYGLNPPDGTYMHWSRTIDLPIGLMIKAASVFVDASTAEKAVRLFYPFMLLVGLYYGVAKLAAVLLGPAARMPAIAATVLCSGATIQFQPGRIAHHSPQVLALLFMSIFALQALDPAKARRTVWAGLLVGYSLSINLENLPFIACFGVTAILFWVWYGAALDRFLRFFGFGLALSLIGFFAATVAPDRWLDPVCDAYGAAHLGAGLVGALACIVLSSASRFLPGRIARLGASMVFGGLCAGYVACVYPACLHDPYAEVAPLVRSIWLSNVTEALSLWRFSRDEWQGAIMVAAPVVLGLGGTLAAAFLWRRSLTGRRFLLLSALVFTGLAMGCWQVRVFTSVTPLAIAGALPLAIAMHDRARRKEDGTKAILSLCLIFPFTSAAWGLVLPPNKTAEPDHAENKCLAPSSFAPLAALPPGRVVAPVDSGSYFLVHTGMTVFAAPYHRDNGGNLLMLESLMAKPAEAETMLRGRGATYVAICPGFGETKLLAKRAPDGLAAALLDDHVPAWLTPVPVANTPYRIFKLN